MNAEYAKMVVCYSLDVEGLLSEFIYDEELMTKSRGLDFNLRGRLDQKGDRSAQNSGIRNETFIWDGVFLPPNKLRLRGLGNL